MANIFVYGTLKGGGSNHARLHGRKFLGAAHTMPGYTLYSLGDYPGMVAEASDQEGVHGELWQVDDANLPELDEFEGVPEGLYRRAVVPLVPPHAKLKAEAYFYARPLTGAQRLGSNWNE